MLTRIIVGTVLTTAVVAAAASALPRSTHASEGSRTGLRATAYGAAARQAAALFVSTSGSDQSTCSKASPCRSLGHAYRVARPGQVVEVAGGSYPDQFVYSDASKTSPLDVVIRPVSGASVSFGRLIVSGASHLTLRGFKTTYWRAEQGADDVTFEQIDTGVFTIGAASNLSVLGGDVGPWDSNSMAEDAQVGISSSATPTGLVFDGVYFHDYTNKADPSAHTECLQFMEGIDVTIRNSRFLKCGGADDVYIRGDFGPIRNFLVENNFFGPTGTFSVRLSGQTAPSPPCENVLVRNNSALERMWSDCTAIGSQGVRFVGNIQPTQDNYHCSTSTQVGTVWEYNVYESGIKCGATDRVGPVSYKDRTNLDLHLRGDNHLAPGSEAIGGGETGPRLRTDIDGDARPFRTRADAGADQREPAALVLGRGIGLVELGMNRSQVERSYGANRVRFVRARRRRVGIASYARSGGRLSVTYSGDRVVGVATTSAYYSTAGGLGVGAELEATARRGWSTCSKAYRHSLGPVTLDFRPAGGKSGKTIARIAMTRRAYAVC